MAEHILTWPVILWALISLSLGTVSYCAMRRAKVAGVAVMVIGDLFVGTLNILMCIIMLLGEMIWLRSHPEDIGSLTVVGGLSFLLLSPLVGPAAATLLRFHGKTLNHQVTPEKEKGIQKAIARFLRGERGAAYPVFWALLLPILIGVIGLASDMARAQAVQTKVQTAADAGALAAVQTAQPVITYGYVPQYDSNGNLIGIQKVITGDVYEIQDPGQAQQAAQNAFNLNMANMVANQDVTVTNANGQIYSRRLEAAPANDDSFTVWASTEVKTFFLGPALKLIDPAGTDGSGVPVSGVGTASIGQPVQAGP